MSDEIKSLASENCHYYAKDGSPRYSIVGKNGKERPVTLRDARANDWVPSVTTILAVADRPGLNIWKARQILEAALTLPMQQGESLDDYATRVIEDSKAQGKKAAEKGTELHAAIEDYIRLSTTINNKWAVHLAMLRDTLEQYGIDLFKGKPEHSFASPLGYGGKIDWHNDDILIDFKTKKTVGDQKQLAWPEHCWQLSAYEVGLHIGNTKAARLINVFIGVDDCEVRIHEWTHDDWVNGWKAFNFLFQFWQIKNKWNGSKP